MGQIVLSDADDDKTLLAIEAGASDVEEDDGNTYIYSDIVSLHKIRQTLEEAGAKIDSVEMIYRPKNDVKIIDEEKARKILGLVDFLESLEDVSSVYANFDIPEEIFKKIV
jgi:transcriptional/translational regulatory protein YebC/TACO1